MRYLFFCVMLAISNIAFTQKHLLKSYQYVIYDQQLEVIQNFLDSTEIEYFHGDNPEILFTLYSDSINQYAKKQIMPHFFQETCFDYIHSEYWPDGYTPICLRVGILSRVTNQESLEQILRNKKYKKILKMKCSRPVVDPVPNNNVSFYTLIKIRLCKIKQERKIVSE